ncbi:MAG: IS110 family transposase [Acidobacteriota bacterium]
MKQQIIAVDFHCKYQKVAWLDPPSGEIRQADIRHESSEAVREFYSQFSSGSVVGMEVSGYSFWFERMVQEMGLELRLAHPGEAARRRRRRQKNDRRDAEHLLELLLHGEFPSIWRASPEQREQRILVRHLVRLVRQRNRWISVLRALVYNYNLRISRGSLSRAKREQIRQLEMSPRLNRLRDELLGWVEQLEVPIAQLKAEVQALAQGNQEACRLMTIPGIGPMTSLYSVLTLGPVERFRSSKQVVSYVGLDSMEHSSDNLHRPRRYGSISKQGDRLLRWLLVECATVAARVNPQLQRFYHRLKYRKGWPVVKTAVARKLLVCSYVLLRDRIDYPEYVRRGPWLGSA